MTVDKEAMRELDKLLKKPEFWQEKTRQDLAKQKKDSLVIHKRTKHVIDDSIRDTYHTWQNLQPGDRAWVEDEYGETHECRIVRPVRPFLPGHKHHDKGIQYEVDFFRLPPHVRKARQTLIHPSRIKKVIHAASGRIQYRSMNDWDDTLFV